MRFIRLLYILHLLLLALAIAHTDKLYGQGQGYAVRRILPTQAVSSSQCGELVGTAGQPICITQRYDASLRPVQRVAEGAAGTGEDLATLQEYDAAGRLTYRWSDTPFSTSNTNGFPTFHTSADFASMSEDGGTTCISYIYEPSSFSRLTSTKGVHSANTSITTEVSYRVPTAVRRYSYLAPYTFRQAGLYTTPLRMERIVDEEGGYMERYTDSRGLMLLQRQGKTGEASTLDTYYIYDALGRLRFVLPPAAVEATGEVKNYLFTQTAALKNYAYCYRYDDRNQLIASYLPGQGWYNMVYDAAGRLVLRSRPSQAAQKQWDYIRYDGLGRPVVRGTVRNTASHTALLSLFQTKLVCERYTGNGLTGYSTDVSLGQNESPLEVYYYDCYSFLILPPFNTLRERVATSDTLWRALGRMTGKYIRSMRDEATCEVSLLAYDARGREVLRRSDNGVSGIARTDSVSYGVRGNALSHTEKYACVNDTLSLCTQYAYDAALRPVAATLNVEASARHGAENYRYETSLFTASYDSYGRLSASTSLAGQGQTAYSYGYGGRRESMSVGGGVYGETLHYDDNGPSEPRADGRITGITMQRGTDNKIADIKYDAFGRLSEGVISSASSPTLSEMYVYDTSGNVEQVGRSVGGVVLNDAVLRYEGHRLTQIEENAPTAGASTSHALHIPYNTDDNAYSYDADGRETRNLTRGVERAVYAGSNLRPDSLCFSGGNALCFGYMSDGRMVEVETRTSQTPLVIPPDVYNAQGDPVFIHHEWREGSVSRSSKGFFKVEVPGGYLVIGKEQVTGFAHGSPEYSRNITPYCYVSDYLGSIRAVIRATDGSVVQRADYMPSGACYAEENASLQPRRFCGKELFTVHGYMTYDSVARMLDGGLPRFNAPDPFQEKYYSLSPYAYCADDAVNLVDPWGKDIYIFDNEGHIVDIVSNNNFDQICILTGDRNNSRLKFGPKERYNTIQVLSPLSESHLKLLLLGGSNASFQMYKFLQNNSKVEWSYLYVYGFNENQFDAFISTSHQNSTEASAISLYDIFTKMGCKVIYDVHGHPKNTPFPSFSKDGDVHFASIINNSYKQDPTFFIYIPKTGELVEFNASSVEADFPEMGFPILDIDEAVVKP